jgi:hypothetical protein
MEAFLKIYIILIVLIMNIANVKEAFIFIQEWLIANLILEIIYI